MYWNSWRIHSKKQKVSQRWRETQKRRKQQLQQLLVLKQPEADYRTAVNLHCGLPNSVLHDLRNCLVLFLAVNWRLWSSFSSEEFSKANVKVLLGYRNNPTFGCTCNSLQLCLIWSNYGSLEQTNNNRQSVYVTNICFWDSLCFIHTTQQVESNILCWSTLTFEHPNGVVMWRQK